MSCAWIIPKAFPTLVPERIFFHKTGHWGQKDWGPLLSRALRIHHLEAVGQLDLEVDHCQSSWRRWSGKGSPMFPRGWGTWCLSISWVETSPPEPLMYSVWPSLVKTHEGRVAKKHQVLSRCWRFDAASAGVERIPKLHHIRRGASWERHGVNKTEPHRDPSTVVQIPRALMG